MAKVRRHALSLHPGRHRVSTLPRDGRKQQGTHIVKTTIKKAALRGATCLTACAALMSGGAHAQDSTTPPDDKAETADTIIVTGTRIANPNMTSVSPITVVNAEEVKVQGNTRVEDLLNSLPQVFANQGSTDANGATGIATVDLRDLGAVRTLVLINGRRLGAGDPTNDPDSVAADLNFIPSALIKRIDLQTGGASATYGSDALAGVVNFVLDTEFEGVRLDAQYSMYNHDNDYGNKNYLDALDARNYTPPRGNTVDGMTKNVTLTIGSSMDEGRGHVVAYAGWRKVNPITQGDRDFSYCGYSAGTSSGINYYTCGGSSTSAVGRFRRTTNVGLGATPVYSPTGASYTINPAAPGTFRTYSSARDGYNFNPSNYFQRPDERFTLGGFASYEINDSFKPYLEVMFMDDHTRAQIAASGAFYGTDFFVNCDNPLLSASQATALCGAAAGTSSLQSLYIGRRNVEGGPRVDDLRHTDYRIVAGMKGDIAKGISYDAYGQFWRAILAERYENDFSRVKINRALNVVTGPGGTPVCAAAIPNAAGQVIDPNCQPWDIFTPGGVSQDSINYLQTPGFRSGQTTEYVASGTISADLGTYGLKTPWTDNGAQLAVGAEYRKEVLEINNDSEFLTGDLAGQGNPFGVNNAKGSYTVKEFFGELAIPLVSDVSGIDTLGLNLGYRYSDYSLAGSTDTYKMELEYAPISQVRFRASYNRAVRAPNLTELFAQPTVGLFSGNDPCVGESPDFTAAQCALTGVTGAEYGTLDSNPANQYNRRGSGGVALGNDLKPEKGDTYTVGVVISPIPSASISIDAFRIKVADKLGTIGAQTILNNCGTSGNAFLCGLIERSPGGSLFTGTGFVGDPTLNLGSLETQGIDVTAAYKMDIGASSSLTFDLVGTYLDKYEVQPLAGALDIGKYDCAGLFGATCGTPLPKWRHKARITWAGKGGLSVSAAWRFFSSVDNDQLDKNPLLAGPFAENPDVQKIKDVSYFDLSLAARVNENYTFRLGAQNLLDKTPPVLDSNYSTNGSNTYAQVYDALGRYLYASVTLDF